MSADAQPIVDGWAKLRVAMTRERPEAFTRNEWAYLITFLDPARLAKPSLDAAAARAGTGERWIAHSRVALWLPNNVSLLGVLALVLVSLAGPEVRVKPGSRGTDLVSEFLAFARRHAGPALRGWLDRVDVQAFGRADERNARMSSWADVRIFFGSDEAALQVESLPHAPGSTFLPFATRVSEAWWTPGAVRDEAAVTSLSKVFALYGQAGCTSPKRVVIVDGTPADAGALVQAIGAAWGTLRAQPVAQAVASEVVMAQQLARAEGLSAHRLPGNAAVLVASPARPPRACAHMELVVEWGSLAETIATAPPNLQTVGHPFAGAAPDEWLAAFAATAGTRLVPVLRMHDFGHVWDGIRWWERLFRVVEA